MAKRSCALGEIQAYYEKDKDLDQSVKSFDEILETEAREIAEDPFKHLNCHYRKLGIITFDDGRKFQVQLAFEGNESEWCA